MEISEIRLKRNAAAKEIATILQTLVDETGLQLADVSVKCVSHSAVNYVRCLVSEVHIELQLDKH